MALQDAITIVSSVSGITAGTATLFPGLWSWVGLSGIALMTSITLLAFMYIWATMFKNPQMYAYVKQELLEFVITAILVIIIFGLVGSLSNLMLIDFLPSALLPDGVSADTNVYAATQMFYEQVDEDMAAWLNLNYAMNMHVDQIASITPYARPLGVGLVASPLTGIASPLKQLLYNMTTALTLAMIINYAQLCVYLFSLNAFLNYYLPLGIFFRCFTPTRRLGGTLIAIAMAFLFIFPALSSITFSMFYNASNGPLISLRSMATDYFSDLPGRFQDSFQSFIDSLGTGSGVMDLVAGALGGIGDLLQALVGSVLLGIFMIPMAIVSFAFTLGFVVPAVNIVIFTAAAKSMSRSLGEEADISALTRMI